jgi:hypothetical protein
VAENKKLFLSAIDWYVRDVAQDKQDAFYVNNPDYSLLHALRAEIESEKVMRDSAKIKLLKVILNRYQNHLDQLRGKLWIRQDVVQGELDDLALLAQIDMVDVRK